MNNRTRDNRSGLRGKSSLNRSKPRSKPNSGAQSQSTITRSEIEVTIEKLAGLGDGSGVFEGKPVFVPFTLPGERVKVRVLKENSKLIRGWPIEIIEKSPERKIPECIHFMNCGGCQLQHFDDEIYVNFKKERLNYSLQRAGFNDVKSEPMVSIPSGCRRRARFQVEVREGGQIQFGLFEAASHRIVTLDLCPLIHSDLNALLPHLKEMLKKFSPLPLGSEVQLTLADNGIELFLLCRRPPKSHERALVKEFSASMKIRRFGWSMARKRFFIMDKGSLKQKVEGGRLRLPPMPFIQATKDGQMTITQRILDSLGDYHEDAHPSPIAILELFSGVGTYTLPLLNRGYRVLSVEGSRSLLDAQRRSVVVARFQEQCSWQQRDLVKRPFSRSELSSFVQVVINPPRTGAIEQIREICQSSVKRVLMVSCSPESLEKDCKALCESGFRLESSLPVDQFRYSYHLESVLVLGR